MNEAQDISAVWVNGVLECSFTTALFKHDENQGITLNHIQPIGRKVLSEVSLFEDQLPIREETSYLEERYLLGLEVFPKEGGIYPLDIARKFNAKDVHILRPEISEIREVNGVRHGLLKAYVICRLHRLNDTRFNDEIKTLKHWKTNVDLSSISGSTNAGCAGVPGINRGCLTSPISSVNSGCLSAPISGVNSGCMSPQMNSGCLNMTRFGCGGLISLLLLFGLIGLLMRACDDNTAKDRSDTTEETDIVWEDDENKQTDTLEYVNTEAIVMPNVQFYTNSNRLLPSSAKDLDGLSLYLLEHLECKANIYGHTDNRGDANFNLRLSQSRANSVRDYLINKGVDANRLKAVGKGETEPRASNSTQEGLLMNRRVEIEIIRRKKVK